jgi:hypothetical protein
MNATLLSLLKELALAGISQADAARRMDVSRQYVHHMARKYGIVFKLAERTRPPPPTPEAIAKMRAAADAKRETQRADDRALSGIASDPRSPLIDDALTPPGKP